MFQRALVKTPGRSMLQGITSWTLGKPDYQKALLQHQDYIAALTACGVQVTVLAADEAFPDSTFVEDTAVLVGDCAIITRPGADSRRGEIAAIEQALKSFFVKIERIEAPGTVDGGDVMRVDRHFYVGLSERTNQSGAEQLIGLLHNHGFEGSTVPVGHMLHLKSGMSYLENSAILLAGEFKTQECFAHFQRLEVPDSEIYAANSLRVNNDVLVPAGFPQIKALLATRGFQIREVDVSEFRKLDGGLSCLSLRF